MTCIVGIETKDAVYIGADSAAVAGWHTRVSGSVKVFKSDEFLIGFTSSFRMGQLLEHALHVEPQEEHQSDMEFLVTTFVSAVRNMLITNGAMRTEDGEEVGPEFIFGYRGKLYEMQSDFQINHFADGFSAIGVGRDYALGYLFDLDYEHDPVGAIRGAVAASVHFCNGVCYPLHVMSMDKKLKVERWELTWDD